METLWAGLRRNRHLVLPLAIFAIAATWFTSNGAWNLFEREPVVRHESVYDAMALNLLAGRVDVPRDALQGEAFIINDRSFTYYPFTPALPRMILTTAVPPMYARWAKLFILLTTLFGILAVVGLSREFAGSIHPGEEAMLATAAGIGSTALFLNTKAFVYHEAIAWGACLTLWSAVYVVRYWRGGPGVHLIAASLLAFFAFFARYSTGLGACALVGCAAIWGLSRRHSQRRAPAAALAVLAATAAVFVGYNYLRFGTLLNAQPVEWNLQYSPERIARAGGSLVNFAAIPRSLAEYTVSPTLEGTEAFPWMRFAPTWLGDSPAVTYDNIEPHASILVTMPALLLLGVAGCVRALRALPRDPLPLVCVAALSAGPLLLAAYVALSHRYVHDFYPVLTAAAVLGSASMGRVRRALLPVLWLCAAYGAFASLALAFVYQRSVAWGVPEGRRMQLLDITSSIDRATGAGKHHQPCIRDLRISGARARFFDCASNTHRDVPAPLEVHLRARLKIPQPGWRQPLFTIGAPPQADIVYMYFENDAEIRLGIDHWGSPALSGAVAPGRYGEWLDLRIRLDPVRQWADMYIEGREVFSRHVALHDWGPDARPLIGLNPYLPSLTPRFGNELAAVN